MLARIALSSWLWTMLSKIVREEVKNELWGRFTVHGSRSYISHFATDFDILSSWKFGQEG
jgi:hypothetical protein